MLGPRVLTAVVGIPILILLIIFGGWILVAGLAVLAAIAVHELGRMCAAKGIAFFPLLTTAWVWAFLLGRNVGWSGTAILVSGFALAGVWTLVQRDAARFQGMWSSTWAAIYLGWFFSFMDAIRHLPHGRFLLLEVLVLIWTTDTAAFFIGRTWGRKKLLPSVSPGKTWLGSAAGLAGAVAVGLGFAVWVHNPWWDGAGLGLGVSVVSQLGDLLESNLKRFTGFKDSGALLPGHGGILDRFDSVLLALPFAYYLLRGLGIG